MFTNLTHGNGKMVCTLANGETATRATSNGYKSAIVGRAKSGKLVICFASYTVQGSVDALATKAAGKFVNHKFTGCTELTLVTPFEGFEPVKDADAWKAADAALIAAK